MFYYSGQIYVLRRSVRLRRIRFHKKAEPAQTGSTVRLLVYQKRGIGTSILEVSSWNYHVSALLQVTQHTRPLLPKTCSISVKRFCICHKWGTTAEMIKNIRKINSQLNSLNFWVYFRDRNKRETSLIPDAANLILRGKSCEQNPTKFKNSILVTKCDLRK